MKRRESAEAAVATLRSRIKAASQVGKEGAMKRGTPLKVAS